MIKIEIKDPWFFIVWWKRDDRKLIDMINYWTNNHFNGEMNIFTIWYVNEPDIASQKVSRYNTTYFIS